MAFDGAFLWLMRKELEPVILGSRVDKIYQPTKNVLVFLLRSKEFTGKLMLSADPSGARIQLTKTEIENPVAPPMLCMLLRKKLVGAKLAALRQPGLERLIYIDFDTKNELGDPIRLTMAAELMGRHSNLILCDETGKMIDAVRRTDASDTTRILMPGVMYQPPASVGNFDLTKDNPADATTAICNIPREQLATELLHVVPGISPIVCRELAFRTLARNEENHFAPLSTQEQAVLTDWLTNLQQLLLTGAGTPTMITDASGKMVDFTFFTPLQYEGQAVLTHAESLSQLLDQFYELREQKARMQAKTQRLNKFLNTTLARLARTVNVRMAELKKAKNCEDLRKYGELLKANLGRISPGASVCRVPDYYTPDCREIEISLSPALSPQQNAQKYFKEYRKQCTAASLLEGLIEKGKADIAYLDSVQEALSRAASDKEVAAIGEELQESGWLKKAKSQSKKSNRSTALKLSPYTFCSADGFTIVAGRNNRQNDQLTLRQAADHDIWFHTKNIPGSHVIIKTDGKDVPDTTLTQAAVIAATLSKAADSQGVAVDYCPVRRVKKPAGAAPGMVIYENYSTAYVNPDKAMLQQLAL